MRSRRLVYMCTKLFCGDLCDYKTISVSVTEYTNLSPSIYVDISMVRIKKLDIKAV